MSRIAQRTKLVVVAMIVPAVAAIAFTPAGAVLSAVKAPHAVVADGPVTAPPPILGSGNHCPTCV